MDVTTVVCPNGNCSPYFDGLPIYYTASHLSVTASWEVDRAMVEKGMPLNAVFSAMSEPHLVPGTAAGR